MPIFACVTFAACTLLALAGCDAISELAGRALTDEAGDTPADPFEAALAEAETGEKPFIEASRPILAALVGRDYAGLYGMMSPHALRKVSPWQFLPPENENAPSPAPFANLTQEQFLEQMAKVEQHYGPPAEIDFISVESIDPAILSGRGNRLEVIMAIGGMPADIPNDIRRAAIRAQIDCHFSEEAVKKIAADLKISEEQVRSGKWPENEEGYDPDERPYYKFKFVLIDEVGQLKIGYFEFVGPSILD